MIYDLGSRKPIIWRQRCVGWSKCTTVQRNLKAPAKEPCSNTNAVIGKKYYYSYIIYQLSLLMCLGCGGVGGVGGVGEWFGPGSGKVRWCYVFLCCDSGSFVKIVGPGICVLCSADTRAS